MRSRRVLVAGVALVALGLGFSWAAWVRPRLTASRQLRNWVGLQLRIYYIDQFRKSYGVYPVSLSEAAPSQWPSRDGSGLTNDLYGHPLYYESDGQRYLVASFGRDGVRDAHGYARPHGEPEVDRSPCRDPDVDTIYSSDGIQQLCGK